MAWPCTGGSGSRARSAARVCSASATPKTRLTTALAARPVAGFCRIGRSHDCSRTTGLARSRSSGGGKGAISASRELLDQHVPVGEAVYERPDRHALIEAVREALAVL